MSRVNSNLVGRFFWGILKQGFLVGGTFLLLGLHWEGLWEGFVEGVFVVVFFLAFFPPRKREGLVLSKLMNLLCLEVRNEE